jgi:hypothetical protein
MSAHGESSRELAAPSPSSVRLSYTEDLIGAGADLFLAAVGGTYEFTRFASANLREKDDSMNTAIGGFLAGSVLGLRCEYLEEWISIACNLG